jgi:hypothetical protein
MADDLQPRADAQEDSPDEIRYHLSLSAAELKITHTALKSLLDDFGHEEHEVGKIVHEVLEKLPDEHSIRAIVLDDELQK